MGPALFSAVALMLAPPHTAWTGPTVQAFAMDGPRMAWISGACRTVRVRKVSGGKTWNLASASRTECDNRGVPMIALAGTRAVWTELTFGNFTYTYVLTRAAGEKAPVKQLDYLVHENDLDGDWMTAMAGAGSRLAYTDLVVEGRTLPDDTDVYYAARGSIRRVVGRSRRILPNWGGPPFLIAVSSTRVAIVGADGSEQRSVIIRSSRDGVDLRTWTGESAAAFFPGKRVRGVALTGSYAALLVAGRVQIYALSGGPPERMTAPRFTAPGIDASGTRVVGRSGRDIWLFDEATGSTRRIATAAATPIGLSIDGHTVAWAENTHGHGRIRTVTVG